MGLEIRLNQRLDLQLKLAPQIIQSIEILQLPSLDLREMIDAELDTNEYLERVPVETAEPGSAPQESGAAGESRDEPAGGAGGEADFDEGPEWRRPRDDEAGERKLEAMMNTPSRGPSLQSHLLDQFRLLELDPRYRDLAEAIIFNIDDSGYLRYDLDDILEPLRDRYSSEDAAFVLGRIRDLDPKGVAGRDARECLLHQLDPSDPGFDLKRRLIAEHLDDASRNRLPKIARDLGITVDEVKDLIASIAHLSPRPGARFGGETPHYIHPDIIVEWSPGGYEVRLANSWFPTLRVSSGYRDVLADRDVPRSYKDYVKKKVDSARWFIEAIQQRQATLLKVARRIVHYQTDFLDFGPRYLRPLKMQQVAEDLGIHVSTVSRATDDKYMETHRGIFPMKYFFTGGAGSSASGVSESRVSIKHRVSEIVAAEDRHNPLSDEDIVERLRSFGIDVARRTVTKYRKALAIPSSRQRREF